MKSVQNFVSEASLDFGYIWCIEEVCSFLGALQAFICIPVIGKYIDINIVYVDSEFDFF